MVVTIDTLIASHDLAFGIKPTGEAKDGMEEINRDECPLEARYLSFCLPDQFFFVPLLSGKQETVNLIIGSAIASHDRALVVDPVGIRSAASKVIAGRDGGNSAGEIKGAELSSA